MKVRLLLLTLLTSLCFSFVSDSPKTMSSDTRCFEMRIYYPAEGKMPDLLARFRNHTTKLFEKHGMTNIGYWLTENNPDSALVYILAYPDRASRDASWAAFGNDPEWKKVQGDSEKKGKLVASVTSIFLKTTDFSPDNYASVGNRIFELRTYKATPYNLGLLLARFRNYTLALFEKHGMTNLVYWTEEGTDDGLIYLLAHKSKEAAKASFDAFRQDPEWLEARGASEKLAKGSITVSVKSQFLIPTDFSGWK